METEIFLKILPLIGGLGTPAFFIIRWVLQSNTETTTFDRGQILALNKRVDTLNTKIEMQQKQYEERLATKDGVIQKKEEEIRVLQKQISDLIVEVSELRHRLANVEQTTAVKQNLKDNNMVPLL